MADRYNNPKETHMRKLIGAAVLMALPPPLPAQAETIDPATAKSSNPGPSA